MVGRAVIALAIVLPDELPVGLLDDGGFVRDLGLMQVVREEVRLEVPSNRLEIRRHLGEAHPDVAADTRAVHAVQPVLRAVESGPHVARREQPAVEMIGPLMIRAHQSGDGTPPGGADSRSAMPARIVECIEAARAVAHDHHGVHADLHGQVVSGIRHLAIMTDEEPIPVPDHVEIDLVFFRAAIKLPLEGGLGFPSSQAAQYDIARIHARLLRSPYATA